MRSRRGFSLVELMLGMVLLTIVGQVVYQLLARTQRVSQAQAERIAMQSDLRGGAAVLPAELREIGYDFPQRTNTDIVAMAADSLAVRSIRAGGVVCNAGVNRLVIDTGLHYSAYRAPVPGRDGLMLFLEGDADLGTDDSWVRRPLTAVGPGVCAASFGARPGLAFTTSLSLAGLTDSLVLGAPVFVYEVMVYKLYETEGQHWLGFYSASDPARPGVSRLLGPLDENGFRLAYLDSAGTATAAPADVRSIRVTLVAKSGRIFSGGGYGNSQQATDSLTTLVALRNTLR